MFAIKATFYLNLTCHKLTMRLIVVQSLATGLIPINTQQQRASLPFKPVKDIWNCVLKMLVLEMKVFNNDIAFFSVF